MNDSQSKITSFFKKPPLVQKSSEQSVEDETGIGDQKGYSSDGTIIYDYEAEISANIAKLQTDTRKKRKRKVRAKLTLPSTKDLNRILKNASPKTVTSSRSLKKGQSKLISSHINENEIEPEKTHSIILTNSLVQIQTRRSSRLSNTIENNDPNSGSVQQVVAIKNRAARKQLITKPMTTEVITIPPGPDEKPRPREFEPKAVYSKPWSDTHSSDSSEAFSDHSKFIKKWLTTWNESFNRVNDDENDIPNNKSLFIHGPNGSGKTSLVYSIAQACGYQIIEHNSSSHKLTASVLQNDLFESSQSHCIGRKNKISNFFQTKDQAENSKVYKSLILFDDIDGILYEERSDLWKNIRQTIRDSRKPIVFTSIFDLTFLTTECDIFHSLRLNPCDSHIIRQKLNQILRVEFKLSSTTSEQAALWKYVSLHCGDVRKAINQLQFWSNTKLVQTSDTVSKHQDVDIGLHSTIVDLLSIEDILNVRYDTTIRLIDDQACDYNLHYYHRQPSLLYYCDKKYASFQKDLSNCLHEKAPTDRNYDRYSYDLKHFYL